MKEYNYFLHTDLWSKEVILALIFLKYSKNVLSNTKKFQITNKHCQTMPNFSNKRPFPLQGEGAYSTSDVLLRRLSDVGD